MPTPKAAVPKRTRVPRSKAGGRRPAGAISVRCWEDRRAGRTCQAGALAWAACGKDTGYTPQFLLEEAQRLAHYPASLLAKLTLREPVGSR